MDRLTARVGGPDSALSISVIIPTLNEASSLPRTLESLGHHENTEIIVADGGSDDLSREIARHLGAEVLESPRGRALQMNHGASAASGSVFLFLHADTLLPVTWAETIRVALADPGVCGGAFSFMVEENSFGLRLIERLTNFRARWLSLPYGDQGIFVRSCVFEEMGRFPSLPIMEDFEFMRRLRKRGSIHILPEHAVTSARRWKRLGVWRTTAINQAVILGYYMGIAPEKLARFYRRRVDKGSFMKALVTGASGFIGSHMAEYLIACGMDVVCPVRDKSRLRHLEGIAACVVAYDELSSEIESDEGFDYVIHLAGATRARDYETYQAANVGRTRDLLESFSRQSHNSRLKRFVLVGSQAAAGPSPDNASPVKESDVPRPVSLYGRSKLEAEQIALSYGDHLPVTIIRPPTVFGPRDSDVLDVFRLAKYRLAPCLAGPDRLVSIVYVEDLVEGIYAACTSSNACSNIYFLANPQPVIWKRFVVEVARICGYDAIAVPIP